MPCAFLLPEAEIIFIYPTRKSVFYFSLRFVSDILLPSELDTSTANLKPG